MAEEVIMYTAADSHAEEQLTKSNRRADVEVCSWRALKRRNVA